MTRQNQSKAFPYMALSAALVGCALFFGVTLWRGESKGECSGPDYVPGFSVQADFVRAVRVVPLAGTAMRSPSVDADKGRIVQLAY
jgi:hypothetical protein